MRKKRIAQKLNSIIHTSSTVFVNGGSTTACCVEELTIKDISIFTNNIVAMSMQMPRSTSVYYLGGEMDTINKVFYGTTAIQTIEKVKADYCILGANGVHPKEGISSYSFNESLVNIKMVKNTIGKVILVIDHSKTNIVSNHKFCDLEEVDVLITGKESSDDFCKSIEDLGIQLHLV